MDMSRARRAKVIDEHAAIFILQGALDRLASCGDTALRVRSPASHKVCITAARLLRPCTITVSQVELMR